MIQASGGVPSYAPTRNKTVASPVLSTAEHSRSRATQIFPMRSNAQLRQNHVLEAFPDDVWERLSPFLELVQLAAGDVLQAAGVGLGNVYFPTQAVISLQCAMKSGEALEVARIGYESVCGISLLMGGETASCRSIVQHPGHAFRIRATVLQREFDRGGAVNNILLRCAQSLLCQVAQTSLCCRHHCVEQQLSRWLLLSLDRMPGNEVSVNHEWIANALGVRRESVTQSLARLRETHCIETGRNRITVLDRASLQAQSCECYGAIKLEHARLAPNRHVIDSTLYTHRYAE